MAKNGTVIGDRGSDGSAETLSDVIEQGDKSAGGNSKGTKRKPAPKKNRVPKKPASGKVEDPGKNGETKPPPPKKTSAKRQVKEARKAVYENLPEIVKGLALKSGDNYLAAKFLFDFAKVEEVSKAAKHSGKPASVAGLLKTLGFADSKPEAATRGKMKGSAASKGEGT